MRSSLVDNDNIEHLGPQHPIEHTDVPSTNAVVVTGVLSGAVCLAVFLVIHAIWITPIWGVAVIGVFLATGGGAAAARCYSLARRIMPARPLSWLAVLGMMAIPLVPCFILTSVLPPLLEAQNGQVVHPINVPWLVTGFFVNLLVPAAVVGAIMGWLISGRRSGAVLFAAMGLLIAVGPGHNLPLFGVFGDATGPQLVKAFVLTFAPMAVGAVVLVEAPVLWNALGRSKYLGLHRHSGTVGVRNTRGSGVPAGAPPREI